MLQRSFLRGSVGLLVLVGGFLVGCSSSAPSSPDQRSTITDSSYLTADLWNDGQAEVAFYQVQRTRDQYGRDNDQRFVAGTYLVKHQFSPAQMSKVTDGSGISSFKYALFYELESGSYQYKRNWVVNARQQDLRPYKQSFTSFDWCSNLYRELAFPPDGSIEVRKRSDDYGNRRDSFAPQANSHPPAQIALLVRGLDFGTADTLAFKVSVADDTEHVPAQAVLEGVDTVQTDAGSYEAERIAVYYESTVPSLVGEESASAETYCVRRDRTGGSSEWPLRADGTAWNWWNTSGRRTGKKISGQSWPVLRSGREAPPTLLKPDRFIDFYIDLDNRALGCIPDRDCGLPPADHGQAGRWKRPSIPTHA